MLYLTAHVVEVNTQNMKRIYGDVYATTYKKPSLAAIDGQTPKGTLEDSRIVGINSDEQLKGLSGWTITTTTHFYVIHASSNGVLASYPKACKPLAPFDINLRCSVCHGSSVPEATPGTSHEGENTGRKEQIRRSPLGNLNVEEYEDRWGVKYDLYVEGNRKGLVCRDIKLWASHVTEDVGIEILPDISTEGTNYRPYGPVESYNYVYTSFEQQTVTASILPRQCFAMFNSNMLYVIESPVFRTTHKLLSGTIVYIWYSGFYPSKENMKAASVITMGRKVGDYYYYPIINDTSNVCEFKCRMNNRQMGYIDKTPFNKIRTLSDNPDTIHHYETHIFKTKQMFRLLSSNHTLVASFEYDNAVEYDPFDWAYHVDGDLLVIRNNQVQGVGSALSSAIDEFDSTADFCKSLTTRTGQPDEPTRVPNLVVACSSEFREQYQFTIYLRKTSTDNVIYSSGKFVVMGQSATLVELIRRFVSILWKCGVELIMIKGDLYELVGNAEISPYDFFSGCEGRQSPTLIFVTENENLAMDVKQWLLAELRNSEIEALMRPDEISIHPDWISGSIALAPSVKHSMTQRSLAEWRQHAQYPIEEIDFTGGNWAPMDTEDVSGLLEISREDYWIGELQSLTSRGSCVGMANMLMTSRHVTRGAPVKIYRKGYKYRWDKPFIDAVSEDFCVYGSEMPKVAKVSKGEILCVICPFRKIGKFLIVIEEQSLFETRPGARFNSMRPIDIDPHYTKWVASDWKGVNGMSGCPIFNSAGKLVSVYGLGKIEQKNVAFDSMLTNSGVSTSALTVMAPDIRPEIVPDAFFRTAATEAITSGYESPITYFLCVAPTGTGKTLYFTKNLMMLMGENKSVILLQPTVAAVTGAYRRLCDLLRVSGSGGREYTIKYLIGQRNNVVTDSQGNGSKALTLMTYGRALMDLKAIQTAYDYVLLDEIHNLNDPTVLACDLILTKPNLRYKCIHLSATIESNARGSLLASHMSIEDTRFRIDETVKIEPSIGNEGSEYLVIPKNVTGVKIPGYDVGYRIPMEIVSRGRILFFLSSRADCEKLVSHCSKNYGLSRQYLAIHAGATVDLSSIREDAWLFCTDIVGQSVTIPGCKVVVDFLEEIKSETKLFHNKTGIIYRSELKRRRIDIFTAKQRKDRTGRTNAGWYITPQGQSPVSSNGVDVRSIAEAMLRLRAIGVYSALAMRDYYIEKILKDIGAINWILPENIVELQAWNEAIRQVNGLHKCDLNQNMADKLRLVSGVSGDLIYLYLTPIISQELIDLTMGERDLSRTGTGAGDREFYKQYQDYCSLVPTEDKRDNDLITARMGVLCDREKVRLPLDLSMELRAMLAVDAATGAGSSEEVEDSMMCTALVVAAAACTLFSGIYWWMENECERSVVRVAAMSLDQVVPACKFYAGGTNTPEDAQRGISSAMKFVSTNLSAAIDWMRSIGVPKEHTHSAGILEMIEHHLAYAFSLVPAAWHIGLVPTLSTIFGATVIGAWYVSLEEVLGPVLSTSLLIALNAGVGLLTPLPMAITCVVSELLAFIISAIASKQSTLYDRYGRSVSYPAKAWRLIFGGVSGVVLSRMVIPPLFAVKPAVMTDCVAVLHTTPVGSNLGRTGLAINIIKQLYVTLVRVQSGRLGVETMGPIFTAAVSAMALDFTTVAVGSLVVVALVAIRKGLEYAKYSVGSVVKSSRSTDGRNPYVEDYFGDFDDMALTALSAAAVFSSPTSVISIAVAWINAASRSGRLSGEELKDAFHVYAGVPVAITIVTEGIKWISSWRNTTEVNHSLLGSLLITIPTALAGLFGSVYYMSKPEVREVLEKGWSYMCDTIIGMFKGLIAAIGYSFKMNIKWIGKQVGEGILQNLPNWMRPETTDEVDSVTLGEAFSGMRPEPEEVGVWMKKQWMERGGLTLIERLHLSTKIGDKVNSGAMPPLAYRNYLKNTGQGVSFIWEGVASIPFVITKVGSPELRSILGHFTLDTSNDAGTITMRRNGYVIHMEMSYTERASVSWIDVMAGMSTFGILIACYPKGQATGVIVVGYKISSGLMRSTLTSLKSVHPVIREVVDLKDTTNLSGSYTELDSRIDLKRYNITLEWQALRTTILLGAVNLYSNITQSFTKEILTTRFTAGAVPDEWMRCPRELSLEEWRVLLYYMFASYEAGISVKETNVPRAGLDLPLQIYARSQTQWRKIPSGLDLDMRGSSKRMMLSMEYNSSVVLSREIEGTRSEVDNLLEGVDVEVTMDNTTNFKNQWLVAAYWLSATVIYKNRGQDWAATIGGHCSCLIYIDTDDAMLKIYNCPDHRYDIKERRDIATKWSMYLGRGDQAGEDLVSRLNTLLARWNAETGRKVETSGCVVSGPEQLTKGFVDSIKSVMENQEVQHARSIFEDAYDKFRELWTTKPVTLQSIIKTALQEISDASLPLDQDGEEEELYFDSLESPHNVIIGWDRPLVNQRPRWSWLKNIDKSRVYYTDVKMRDIERQSARVNNIGSKLVVSEWERIKNSGRVELPKRSSEEHGSYVSRAGMKMQQLWEADPDFWEDNRVYLDPTSGYGGFVEFLAMKLRAGKPRQYVMSTLYEKGHRVIDPRITTLVSNLRPIIATSVDHLDKGNIKDPRCRLRLKQVVESCGGLDMLVLDAGEFSTSLKVNRQFWLQPLGGVTFLDAAVDLLKSLNKGGRLCFKVNGIWDGCFEVIHGLTRHFREIKAIKLGTSGHASPEFYVFARGYSGDRVCSGARAQHLLNLIMDATYDSYLAASKVLMYRGRGMKPIQRYDWYSPVQRSGTVKVHDAISSYPPSVSIMVAGEEHHWNPNWDDRLRNFKSLVRSRGHKWLNSTKINFENVTPIGAIARKRTSHAHKNIENGLISGFMQQVFSLNLTNSTFCHTQSTDKWKEMSQKKRLDVDPGHMDQASFAKLVDAFELTDSGYGRSLYGQCRLLTKDEVLTALNYQGAKGILDAGHTMRDFLLQNENWYEISLRQIDSWLRQKDGGTYFTCRPKNEPKKKKNSEGGKLHNQKGVSQEELESYNEQGHRFIQFADAQTRLSHYILLGDLISKANKCKVYKGTINGTPVMRQGNVLRALWDKYLPQEQRDIKPGTEEK